MKKVLFFIPTFVVIWIIFLVIYFTIGFITGVVGKMCSTGPVWWEQLYAAIGVTFLFLSPFIAWYVGGKFIKKESSGE